MVGPPCSYCASINTKTCGKWPFVDRYTFICEDCKQKFDYWGSDLETINIPRPDN